jgi:polar amino acid transport system ATP-binding protein
MVVVTHVVGFARRVADQVAVLADGRIVEQGPPGEVLERPQAPETRAWLGEG